MNKQLRKFRQDGLALRIDYVLEAEASKIRNTKRNHDPGSSFECNLIECDVFQNLEYLSITRILFSLSCVENQPLCHNVLNLHSLKLIQNTKSYKYQFINLSRRSVHGKEKIFKWNVGTKLGSTKTCCLLTRGVLFRNYIKS